MAKTYANLVTEAREILQDTEEPYRYSTAILINKLNRGLQSAARIRPDAFWDFYDMYEDEILVPEIADEAGLTATFPLAMQFYSPLVSFVVAWAEVLDDEFTNDGRAAMLFANFKTELLGL